jgi:hypothetical protein
MEKFTFAHSIANLLSNQTSAKSKNWSYCGKRERGELYICVRELQGKLYLELILNTININII